MRIKVEGKSLLPKPVLREVTNRTGFFTPEVERTDGWLTLMGMVQLADRHLAAADWPYLPELLPDEANPANITLVLHKDN